MTTSSAGDACSFRPRVAAVGVGMTLLAALVACGPATPGLDSMVERAATGGMSGSSGSGTSAGASDKWADERADERADEPAVERTDEPAVERADEPAVERAGEPAVDRADERAEERLRLVREAIMSRGITDEAVVRAMEHVPRHLFVPESLRDRAYGDHPLPIGHGQTISQPYIVALMTQVLQLEPGDKVLEVGTGSGYQAAVLAELGVKVFSIEIIGALVESAREALAETGYSSVEVRHGDGYLGWPDHAPYDAIIVTAAPDHVPPPLKDQLSDGGRMVIPVGPVGGYQELWLVERRGDDFPTTSLGGVAFVPLTRGER